MIIQYLHAGWSPIVESTSIKCRSNNIFKLITYIEILALSNHKM